MPASASTASAATDPTTVVYDNGSGLVWGFVFRDADNQSRFYTVNTGSSAAAAAATDAAVAFGRRSMPAAPKE